MAISIVSGSCGLVGSETARLFGERGFTVIGIDNDSRSRFFGDAASTQWCQRELENLLPDYRHYPVDIRHREQIHDIFSKFSRDIKVIIHTAAQPSHDWASRDPWTDFTINS